MFANVGPLLGIFCWFCSEWVRAQDSCFGPIELPVLDGYRFKQTATEEGTRVLAEISVTSEYPVSLTWVIREYYDEWPNTALYYYVPDEGDDNFELIRRHPENFTTTYRIKGGPIEDAKKAIYARISYEHPCSEIVLSLNLITLQLLEREEIHMPELLEVPQPQYIVAPGTELTLTLRTASIPGASTYRYGFSRHLNRAGDKLVVEQRFHNISRYKPDAANMNYHKTFTTEDGKENLVARIKFAPWFRSDSGVFSVSHQTSYWIRGSPYEHYTYIFIQIFTDIRSRRQLPPAVMLYNELAWIFNKTGPTDVIPQPKKSRWSPSVMCIAHAQTAPRLQVGKTNGARSTPLHSGSRVFNLKTVTGVSYTVKKGSKKNYTCETLGDSEASQQFRFKWYSPVKIVRRSPQERTIRIKRKRNVRVACAATGSPRAFVKFYIFKSMFDGVPHRKDFPVINKQHQIQDSGGYRINLRYNRKKKMTTGTLAVPNSDLLKSHDILLCLAGNDYSYDFYRYFIIS